MGQTGSGKTALAESLATSLDALLVNADAFQVYRGMDIGTAKPSDKSRYALLDLKNPDEDFGVGEWVRLACAELDEAWKEGRSCVVVGGTGLYVRALFEEWADLQPAPTREVRSELERRLAEEGLPALYAELAAKDPEAAQRVDPNNPSRVRRALERLAAQGEPLRFRLPAFHKTKFEIRQTEETLHQKLETRIEQMVHNGWSQEVLALRDLGYTPANPGFRAIGYRQMWRYLERNTDLREAIAATIAATRQYAKRQRTWLRSEPELKMLSGESASEVYDRAIGALEADVD